MNSHHIIFGCKICIPMLGLILAACSTNITRQGRDQLRLAACSAEGSIFETLPYAKWSDAYHARVSAAVNVHIDSIGQSTTLPLACTAENYELLVPASEELRTIAAGLPEWKNEERINGLTEADFGVVMLEFLRVYECALNEQELYSAVRIEPEEGEILDVATYSKKIAEMKSALHREQKVARAAMERTLNIVSGYDRLRPLTLDIECLKRSSLDLRNILGLAADASSCLPRIWDAKGSLRDL